MTKLFPFAALLVFFATGSVVTAEDRKTLLFEDDFKRTESQEKTDEPGNGWGTNSRWRAGGNKQVDLKDGALHIVRHATADHAVSVTHEAKFKDCRVELRFKLGDRKDDLGIDFADMGFPAVHAGHICKVMFRPTNVEILDFKNGRMKKSFRDAKLAGTLTPKQLDAVKKFQIRDAHPIKPGIWHSAVVTIRGDTLSVQVDGEQVLTWSSPGIAHPEKDKIRFSVKKTAWLDDVKVFAIHAEDPKPSE